MTTSAKELADKLLRLSTGLQGKDTTYCGKAPSWIVKAVLDRLETIDKECEASELEAVVKRFALGGIRFVADQGASECEVLLGRLDELLN